MDEHYWHLCIHYLIYAYEDRPIIFSQYAWYFSQYFRCYMFICRQYLFSEIKFFDNFITFDATLETMVARSFLDRTVTSLHYWCNILCLRIIRLQSNIFFSTLDTFLDISDTLCGIFNIFFSIPDIIFLLIIWRWYLFYSTLQTLSSVLIKLPRSLVSENKYCKKIYIRNIEKNIERPRTCDSFFKWTPCDRNAKHYDSNIFTFKN